MNPYAFKKPAKKVAGDNPLVGPIPSVPDRTDELTKQLFGNEISVSESDVYRALSPYGANIDSVVRAKGLKIYREMCEDDQVKACLEIRKQALLASDWTIEPADDSPTAKMYADFITECLERMDGSFETTLYEMYSAMEYGFSVTEIVLKVLEDGDFKGKLGLKCLKTREPYNYDFKTDVFGNVEGLVYVGLHAKLGAMQRDNISSINSTGIWPGLSSNIVTPPVGLTSPMGEEYGTLKNPFPRDKFIIYSYNSQFGNPYGRSDLLACFRHWVYKKFVMRFWTVWLERYAAPFVTATYDQGLGLRRELMDEIDDFITNLSARTGIRVPKGVTIEISKTDRATGDIYELAVEAYNRYMSHALLCPNLLGFTGQQGGKGGGGGSYALGKQHTNAFLWTVEKMAQDTSEIIVRDQLVSKLLNLNFPNVDDKLYPTFKYDGFDEDSIEKRANIIAVLGNGGFVNPDEPWVREFLMLPKEEPGTVLQRPTNYPGFSPDDQSGSQPGKPGDKPVPAKKEAPKPTDNKKMESSEPSDLKEFKERKPNRFEEKLQVKEFAQKLDTLETQLFNALAPKIEKIRDEVVAYVQKKNIIENGDHRTLAHIPLNVGDLKRTLRAWLAKIFLDSKLRALEEIGRAGVDVKIVKKFTNDFADEVFSLENWTPLQPSDAVDYFNKKVLATIISKEGVKTLLTLANRTELSYYDSKALAIAGVVRDDILNDAKQVLLNAIKRNDVPGGISDLKDVFNKYVDSGIMEDGELLAPHRLSTIVRTNMMDALNNGRQKMYQDPDVTGFVPFWQYSAIIDDRTTDYCTCMDGKSFRLEDINLYSPPAHFNCRSISVPITTPEIQDMSDNGEGVEIGNACPDRMMAFKDIKRDPIQIPATEPIDTSRTEKIPQVIPQLIQPVKLDAPGVPVSQANIEATKRLKDELNQIISHCPYSTCHSFKVSMKGWKFNVGEFECQSCGLPFKVSSKGDLYLYDAGIEKWDRASTGLVPAYFSESLNKLKLKNG